MPLLTVGMSGVWARWETCLFVALWLWLRSLLVRHSLLGRSPLLLYFLPLSLSLSDTHHAPSSQVNLKPLFINDGVSCPQHLGTMKDSQAALTSLHLCRPLSLPDFSSLVFFSFACSSAVIIPLWHWVYFSCTLLYIIFNHSTGAEEQSGYRLK